MSNSELNAVAVVLAAGRSTRMGAANKLLLEVEPGVSMVRRVVENAIRAQVADVIVVTGHEPERVRDALRDTPCRVVYNPRYSDGLSSSLQTGFAAARDHGADGAVILLGDMPFVSTSTIDAVLEAARRDPARLVQPMAGDKPAHPVWLPARLSSAIGKLEGDKGARELDSERVLTIDVDERATVDIDTEEVLSREIEGGNVHR